MLAPTLHVTLWELPPKIICYRHKGNCVHYYFCATSHMSNLTTNMTKSLPPKNVVLYADDDPDDLMLVQEAFTKYSPHVEVITVSDGIEALSYLKNLSSFDPSPCLIILDINMPRINGKDALKSIRQMQRFQATPVVLFTTSSQPADKDFARRYDAGFLTKPIDLQQMQYITQQFVDHCTDEVKKNIRRHIG